MMRCTGVESTHARLSSQLERAPGTPGMPLHQSNRTQPLSRDVWLAMNGCLWRIFASPLASVAAIKGKPALLMASRTAKLLVLT